MRPFCILNKISTKLPDNRRLDLMFKATVPEKEFGKFLEDTNRNRIIQYLENHESYILVDYIDFEKDRYVRYQSKGAVMADVGDMVRKEMEDNARLYETQKQLIEAEEKASSSRASSLRTARNAVPKTPAPEKSQAICSSSATTAATNGRYNVRGTEFAQNLQNDTAHQCA